MAGDDDFFTVGIGGRQYILDRQESDVARVRLICEIVLDEGQTSACPGSLLTDERG